MNWFFFVKLMVTCIWFSGILDITCLIMSTDRDAMCKACDAFVGFKPYLNINFTEKMQIITPSLIDQVFHVFSSRRNYW